MHPRMYPSYRGAHANRGRKTESSERRLRAERGGKRLWLTRRRRLRTGREATLRSDEHRATGAASGGGSFGAPSRRLAGGHGQRGTGPRSREHPNCSRGQRIGGAIGVGTGNRVSVNGARPLGRATGSESNFGNGGSGNRPDRVGGHRRRATGGGAEATGSGNRQPGHNGHRPPSLRARRAMCRSSEG